MIKTALEPAEETLNNICWTTPETTTILRCFGGFIVEIIPTIFELVILLNVECL